MKRTRTWWTIKFLKYYEAVNSEYSLSPGDMCCLSHHHHRPKLKAPLLHYPSRRKTKKFWLKESVIQARCCVQWFSFHSAVSCRRHLSVFDWNITERRLLGARFSQISLESLFLLLRSLLLLCYVMLCTSLHIRQLVLTCASDMHSSEPLKQLLWYKVALIMKWDAALDAISILKWKFIILLLLLNTFFGVGKKKN